MFSAHASDSLTGHALLMIGALSTHDAGCWIISEATILNLFAQIFLSSSSPDARTSLTILSNVARRNLVIPQISLIVSCLVQDLTNHSRHRNVILTTLIELVIRGAGSVQKDDLQLTILPLISVNQDPVIVALALRLLAVSDAAELRGFYKVLAEKVFLILSCERMLYPEILTAAAELIASMWIVYDMTLFMDATKFVPFLEWCRPQIENFEEVHTRLHNAIYLLTHRHI
jgi:hypothetical protein